MRNITKHKNLLRASGIFFLLDGASLVAFDRAYVRRFAIGAATNPYRRAMEWLARWPAWLLRAAGVAEAGLGLAVLARAPVGVRTLYRAVAGVYDAAAPLWQDWLYRDAHQAFDQALETHLPADGRVLDLGCGTGANLERLLALELPYGTYTGVDLSGDMLARARARFGHLTNADFRQMDLLADPLPDGAYDLVVSTWAFEHLPDPAQVVEKVWDRLRPGAHAVLLFEVETPSLRSRLIDPIWRWFSAHLVREEEYGRFPGLVSVDRFEGLPAPLALVVLHKPEDES